LTQFLGGPNIYTEEHGHPMLRKRHIDFTITDFTRDGKLNVSFDYIDWVNSEFGPMGREHYYMYKKFVIWPEKEYAINWVKKIKDYVKEQDELKSQGVRVSIDDRNDKMGYKSREAQMQKIHYQIVVG
ncbi:immunity protein YezG family protein, partial [Staphylococcus aureus]|uniref:immunity protein YezG family protein n=1 Tax=Staphylococcus aureus TaxID=1280 RepID=UPI00272E322D